MLRFLFGFLLAFLLLPVAGYTYLRYGHPPVAVSDTPFLDEAKIVHIPLNVRIDREIAQPPFTHPDLDLGAHLYSKHCSVCHGAPARDSAFAKTEYPTSPQLWKAHGKNVVGVSDDPPGETYWKIANGIRLTGMPAFQHVLTGTEMWQLALLLKQADQPLPASAKSILDAAIVAPSQQ